MNTQELHNLALEYRGYVESIEAAGGSDEPEEDIALYEKTAKLLDGAADKLDQLQAERKMLADLVRRFCLSTDEGDDKAQGTHYVDKGSTIRAKGSFLGLLAEARNAVKEKT